MPLMVKIEGNPDFVPADDGQKALWVSIKKKPAVETDYALAMDNIANSRGMYRIVPEQAPAPVTTGPRALEDMTADELKVVMLSAGVKPEKGMKKAQVIDLIRKALADIDVGEDS